MHQTPLKKTTMVSSTEAPNATPPNASSKQLLQLMSTSPCASSGYKRKAAVAMAALDEQTTAKQPKPLLVPVIKAHEKENVDSPRAFLHESLRYKGKGKVSIKPEQRAALQFINERFAVPDENVLADASEFGPLSGTCYEERVLSSYVSGKLSKKSNCDDVEACTVCVTCGMQGHRYTSCKQVLLL